MLVSNGDGKVSKDELFRMMSKLAKILVHTVCSIPNLWHRNRTIFEIQTKIIIQEFRMVIAPQRKNGDSSMKWLTRNS